MRRDAVLTEVAEQLVQMEQEEALFRHGVEIAIETVDHEDARLVFLHRLAHEVRELAGLELRRIDLPDP